MLTGRHPNRAAPGRSRRASYDFHDDASPDGASQAGFVEGCDRECIRRSESSCWRNRVLIRIGTGHPSSPARIRASDREPECGCGVALRRRRPIDAACFESSAARSGDTMIGSWADQPCPAFWSSTVGHSERRWALSAPITLIPSNGLQRFGLLNRLCRECCCAKATAPHACGLTRLFSGPDPNRIRCGAQQRNVGPQAPCAQVGSRDGSVENTGRSSPRVLRCAGL